MKVRAAGQILAVVTMHREKVGGQAPIFILKARKKRLKLPLILLEFLWLLFMI